MKLLGGMADLLSVAHVLGVPTICLLHSRTSIDRQRSVTKHSRSGLDDMVALSFDFVTNAYSRPFIL